MILIIAEKPALGRSIADAIPGTANTANGCITKGDYTIVWAYGHLMSYKAPEEYDSSLEKWTLDALPIFFRNWEQKPSKSADDKQDKSVRLKQIGNLLKTADSVIHAGDPDEEGQLLIDEILRYFKYSGKVYRLETGDTTTPALQKALKSMKDNNLFVNAGWSAYARGVADLTVGVNMTRYFSIHNAVTLSIGRVQTPTLGMVIARDMLIEGHKKLKYFDVLASLKLCGDSVIAKYKPAKDDPNISDDGKIVTQTYAQSKVDMLKDESFSNISIAKKTERENPPLPFNLVKLQSYCSKKYGYDPTEVLEITQKLRDNYNAITYNRSDCQYLSENHFTEAPATMAAVCQNISFKPKALDMSIKSKCFNDANITAHFAIIPQNKRVDLNSLSAKERNVYLAICKFYMAQFMPSAVKEKSQLVVPLIDGGELVATSTKVVDPGYLAIFSDVEPDEISALSQMSAGQHKGECTDAYMEEKETKPPSRYTKATLNEDMTRIAKYVDDPNIKKLLLEKDKDKKGENGSIGTSATRATIIDKLISRGFLKADGKAIFSTPLAREFFRILPDELKKPDMTALWWVIQEDIRNGSASHDKLTDNVMEMINRVLKTNYPTIDPSVIPSRGKSGASSAASKPLGACPRCGKAVLDGKLSYSCSGWREGCKFSVWKQSKLPMLKNVKFTATDIKAFLSGKSVKKDKLVKKDGSLFSASLIMNDDPSSPYGVSFSLAFSDSKKG